MKTQTWMVAAGLMLCGHLAHADASYQESVQITGGQFVDTLKAVPFVQKQVKKLLDPIDSSTLLHGNQLASVSKNHTQIIDLDRETITQIDADKKTYSVTTFAQLRQAFKDAPKKLEQAEAQAKQEQAAPPSDAPKAPPLQVTYEVSVVDTGVSKVVNGLMAKEQLLTLKAHVTDPSAAPNDGPNSVTYSYISDIWTTPEPPELKDIHEFYLRYGKKLMQGLDAGALMKSLQPAINGASLGPLFASNPGMGTALQDMMKKMAVEMQKIKGVTLLQITRFGGEALTMAPGATPETPPTPAAGSVASQAASDTATNAATSQTSKLGTLGSALGHSLLGAIHHGTPAPAATPNAAPVAPNAMLYETTAQKSDFSHDPVPPAAFQVPDGYTQVATSLTPAS